MADFTKTIDYTFKREGGYINHPNDPGGKTNYGITEVTARIFGYKGDMKDFKKEDAVSIYKLGWWTALRLDEVDSQTIATELFDTAVLCGHFIAIDILQKVMNSLNIRNKYGNDLKVDGKISSAPAISETIVRLNEMTKNENVENMIWMGYNILQGAFHLIKCLQDARLRPFIEGWLNNRVELHQ